MGRVSVNEVVTVRLSVPRVDRSHVQTFIVFWKTEGGGGAPAYHLQLGH